MSRGHRSGFSAAKILMAFMAIFLLGLGSWYAYRHSNQPDSPVIKTKIVIANIGEYSIFNLIAKDKGFFDQNGLDVEIKEYSSGPPAVADMLVGSADFAVAADFVGVNQIFAGSNIRILAQASQHDVFSIVGRRDKGINSPADIKGKRIGVTRKGAGEFFLGRFLIFNNLKLSDITVVDLQPTDLVEQLKNGQLDAVTIFEPHSYNLRNILGEKLSIYSAQGQEKSRAIIYTKTLTATSQPELVKQYIRSLVEAETYVKTHPEEAKDILANKMGYSAEYINYLWPKIEFSLSLPQELLLTMENEARYAIQNKLTSETTVPNYLNYIYFDGLNNVKHDAVTIVH